MESEEKRDVAIAVWAVLNQFIYQHEEENGVIETLGGTGAEMNPSILKAFGELSELLTKLDEDAVEQGGKPWLVDGDPPAEICYLENVGERLSAVIKLVTPCHDIGHHGGSHDTLQPAKTSNSRTAGKRR